MNMGDKDKKGFRFQKNSRGYWLKVIDDMFDEAFDIDSTVYEGEWEAHLIDDLPDHNEWEAHLSITHSEKSYQVKVDYRKRG